VTVISSVVHTYIRTYQAKLEVEICAPASFPHWLLVAPVQKDDA